MNVAIFLGNLGRDAELKPMPNGDGVLNFSIGVATGSRAAPETMWVRCAMYGKRAMSLEEHLKKGSKVVVSGPVSLSSWNDKDGNTRTDLRMKVAELSFAGSRPSEESGSSWDDKSPPQRRAGKPARQQSDAFEESDIPF